MIRKIPIVPTLVVLIAAAIMVRLGFWQIDRLHEKTAMLAQYEASAKNTDLEYMLPHTPEAMYRRVAVYCDDVQRPSVRSGRNYRGESGWSHVVRCTTGGMRPGTPPDQRSPDYVLHPLDVVIGWSANPTEAKWSGGEVTGWIAPGPRLVADPPLAGLQPNAKPDPRDLPNNHLAYAVQWFAFAVVALVIYALALRKRWRG